MLPLLESFKVRCISIILAILIFNLINIDSVCASDKLTISIKHKPFDYFVPGKRIDVTADVSDPSGVDLVRCYFRAEEHADYVFVSMGTTYGSAFQGVIPAPDSQTKTLQYLFLVKNKRDAVAKTQVFYIKREEDKPILPWQQIKSEDVIQASTELDEVPDAVMGFSDQIKVDAVESSARFFLVADTCSESSSGESVP